MKRPGTRQSNRKLIDRIRTAVPGVSVRSSFIVGFPGETPDDFEQLLSHCQEVEFDHLGVFAYSHEEGTESYSLKETVSARDKARRRDRLMQQQARISLLRNRERVGRRFRVLVEGPSFETELLLRARSEGQAPEIDSAVLINDGWAEPGTFAIVEVTEAHPYDLVGSVVSSERSDTRPTEPSSSWA
jgi:ribosomal protein S12 methylthiotransferase